MAWLLLIVAGFFETAWAIGLKHTEGFTRLYPSLFTITSMAISFILLSLALKTLPLGTAYTVWTGIGAAGTIIYGLFFLGEPANLLRLFCLSLIIIAIVGLKISEN